MSFRTWWRTKSGQSKTITILCVFLLLDIGLCFATPSAVTWLESAFHFRTSDPLAALGYMMIQAVFCLVLLLAIVCVSIFWHPGLAAPRRKKEKP